MNDTIHLCQAIARGTPSLLGHGIDHIGIINNTLNTSFYTDSELSTTDYPEQRQIKEIGNKTALETTFHPHFTWFEASLLVLCLTGILGNLLNLLVLTKRRFRTALNNLESSANYGLVALAISDLCFCSIVLPHVFLPGIAGYMDGYVHSSLLLVYKLYGVSAINYFQMTSTWIIIIIAINRWIVVMYPLRAKQWIDKRVTVLSIICVFVVSTILTSPFFLYMTITSCHNLNGDVMYELSHPWSKTTSRTLQLYIRWVWPIFANFIPLFILVWCNVQLVIEIKHAMRQEPPFNVGRRVTNNKVVESKVTVTLLSIVMMYLLLVTPVEIIRYVNPYEAWGEAGVIVANFFNLLLTVNFAFNFLLYCAVNATFRQTVKEILRPRKRKQSSARGDYYRRVVTNRPSSSKTEASLI